MQAGLVCLLITILVDSCMWQRPTWPSGEAFLTGIWNGHQASTIQPFLWYLYSAIPRALSFSALFVPLGVYLDRRMIPLLSVCSAFILLNSFFPHKESRFIIYTFPLFNVIASCGCNILWNGRHKSFVRQCFSTAAALHLGGNLIITITLLSIAYSNYPGGTAIQRLHSIVPSDSNVDVYIDESALKSGVTRFTEINHSWKYNTSQGVSWQNEDISKFTHVLIEARSKYSKNLRPFFKSHDVIDTIEGFSHLHINYQYFPPFRIKTKPILSILQRKDSFRMRDEENDETVDIQSAEDMESNDAEDESDGFRLESQHFDTVNQIRPTETGSPSKPPIADQIPTTTVKTSKDIELNVSWQEGATLDGSVTKLTKLLATSNKGKRIRQLTEPESTSNHARGEEESQMSEHEQVVQQKDSSKVHGDFLGESEEIAQAPVGKMSKLNSRINKSSMKIIRSKTNNLAFDALQDALREEGMSKLKTTETPENQLFMITPLVSGRRQFVMPNVDPEVTVQQGEAPKIEQRLKEGTGVVPTNGQEAKKSQIKEETVIQDLQHPQGGGSLRNVISHPINVKTEFSVNSRTNEMVQYNPKSNQLTVLNQNENAHDQTEPTTAVDISVPIPIRSDLELNKRKTKVQGLLHAELEQTLEEKDAGNALQLYETNPSEAHSKSTTLAEGTKGNSFSGKGDTYQRPFAFIWFPEELKAPKEKNREETRSS